MERIYIILGILAVFGVGYWRIRKRLSKVEDRISFLDDFHQKFAQFANTARYSGRKIYTVDFDSELYGWLTHNVNRAQRELRNFGIVDYTAPFRTHRVPKYLLLLNTLPKFRQGTLMEGEVELMDDALMRRAGFDQEILEVLRKDLRNPLEWFRCGIQALLGLPVKLLEWFGIIGGDTSDRVVSNWLFKLISGIVALVSFLSGLVTIFAGWDQSKAFLEKLFGQ